MNVFVGRQPILDLQGNIFGYELLYRNSEKNTFPMIDPDRATIELIVNTFLSIGAREIAGERTVFINFTGNLLAQDIFGSFDAESVVIEILEDVAITPALISRVRELKEDGFRIAMDDFILQEQYDIHSSLFNYIDYLKIDFLNTTAEERVAIEDFSKKYLNIALLAEKVETETEFINAKESGYTLFQGYFFSKPEIIKGFEIPPNIALHYQVINSLTKDTPNFEEISELIKRDISLSYKFLRFINSPGVGVQRKISSIKQALVLVGLNEMKKWIHVLALRELEEDNFNGRVQALIEYSLTRAKMCELLAKRAGKKNLDEYFLAGMFSLMDVIMKREWSDILPLIPLTDAVSHTLEGKETVITPYVKLAEAVERFNLGDIEQYAEELGIDYVELSNFSQEANRWSRTLD